LVSSKNKKAFRITERPNNYYGKEKLLITNSLKATTIFIER
jgi:hypothetical protein